MSSSPQETLRRSIGSTNSAPPSARITQPVNVEWFGAVGDGGTDDTAAIQAALDACPNGGAIIIPLGKTFKVTSSITQTGKNFTIYIQGKIIDRFAAWVPNSADLTLTGKGVFAFKTCAVSIIGSGNTCYDGGQGTAGVSQTQRNSFFFLQCEPVFVQGIISENHTGPAVATCACTHVKHLDCSHQGGQALANHSRSIDLTLSNIRVYNANYNGIGISDRGLIDVAALAAARPQNVSVVNCLAYGTTGPLNDAAAYAVGITIDSADYWTCTGCVVDNRSIGTMGYSFALSTKGTAGGNVCVNVDNTTLGLVTYCGIGFECVDISDCNFVGNQFINTICGYQIARAVNCIFDGTRTSASATASASIANAFASCGGDGATPCDNIRISGVNNGGGAGIVINGDCGRIHVQNFHSKDATGILVGVNAIGVNKVKRLLISDCSSNKTFAQTSSVIGMAVGVVTDLIVSGFVSECSAVGVGQKAIEAGTSGGSITLNDIRIVNSETGVLVLATPVGRFTARNIHFSGVTTPFSGNGNATYNLTELCTNNGASLSPAGEQASCRFGDGVGANNAAFIGQFAYDTVLDKLYIAKAVGGGAADWTILN